MKKKSIRSTNINQDCVARNVIRIKTKVELMKVKIGQINKKIQQAAFMSQPVLDNRD